MTEARGAAVSTDTLASPDTVTTILADLCDWQEPVRDAARLAAQTGRRLKVVLADGGDLLTAFSLDCGRLVATQGPVRTIDRHQAQRLLNAQIARLRQELEALAERLGIAVELTTLGPKAAGFWAGSMALTVFGRRRRGTLLVIHAGTAGTLEVAARLAAERRQSVRLLAVADGQPSGDPDTLARLLGRWLEAPPESVPADQPLASGKPGRIAALVLDPAYVESRKLTPETLMAELRLLMAAA